MRTAIYVERPTRISIKELTKPDLDVVVSPYNPAMPPRAAIDAVRGGLELSRGIYVIVSSAPLLIAGQHIRIETSLVDKDGWPDPPLAVVELEKGATVESVKSFFSSVAKDLEV